MILELEKYVRKDLEIFTKKKSGTTGVTCTCKRGRTKNFKTVQKLLKPFENLNKSFKTISLMKKIILEL